MNHNNPSIENPYDNKAALKELFKMIKRRDKITVSYEVDKYGYATAKLDSKTITEPFNLQMSDELYDWLIDGYLINGEIREPIPSADNDLLKSCAKDSNEFATNTLISYINRVGFRLYMRVTPEIADKPVYDKLKRGQIIIKKGATADVAKLAKSLNAAKGRGYIFSF